MTSHEILKAHFLDILFENRNKNYGAYPLRRFYNNRLGFALAISISSVLFICLLIGMPNRQITIPDITNDGFIEITPVDFTPPLEKQSMPSSQRKQIATQQHTTIDIVPDNMNPVITILELSRLDNVPIAAVTQPGDLSANQIPLITNSGNDKTSELAIAPEEIKFDPVEKQPEFPGGHQAWIAFLNKHLRAPDELNAGERKTTLVRFLVSEDGSITSFEILQSAGSAFDNEVIRVLKKMPKWKPAIQNGHGTAIMFIQPVTFQGIEE
jgi:protein TonB